MRNYLHYLLILLFGVTQWGIAQTPQQAAKIVATYDQNELSKLKNEADLKYQYERNRVLDLAPKMGLPLIIDDGITRSELQRILPDGTPIYYTTNNKDAAHSTRTDHLNAGGSLGLNLMGQNMTAYVWDGGLARATHQEYNGRYSKGDSSTALNDHAGHVTGTIIASGVVAQAKGMAPQAKVRGYDWNNDISEATAAAADGMLVSNHSYGWVSNDLPAWYFGNYHQESASWDNIMFLAPYYLMVKSAGNDGAVNYNSNPLGGIVGYDKLTGAGTSKNSLVIANAQDANVNSNGDLISVSINSGSSQGPTDDYRIKPDITGNGTGLYSSISTGNSAYDTYTGTSMSSPNVTGTLLLLQQHYSNINSDFMRAATLKGLVLHTADDAGPVGPDVVWGWGLLNAKRAAQVISNNGNGTLIQELTLNNGETYEFDVYSDEVSNLMASISWTDRPGTGRNGELNNTNPVLVNDLDLRIIKGGTSYEPWKLTGVTTNAKGDNFRDPYERVEVSNPTGQYKIRITHKGSLTGGSQKYSLIITGISDQPIECNPVVPAGLTATSVGTTTADLIWNMVPAAEYDFRYRATGSGSWITSSTATNTISLTGLTQDTEYEAQVRSKCSGGSNSAWSSSYIFTTLLPSTDCGIEYEINWGGSALGDTSAGIVLASDFPVGADVDMMVETVKFPMMDPVSTVKISFYKDASGTPGAEVLPPTSVVPVSQTVLNSNVYEIVLDLSSLNLELEGGSTGNNYWMAISTTTTGTYKNYWMSTDQIYNGTNGYGSLDNYASFENLANYGYVLDFAFTIEGDCGGNEQFTVVTSANPTAGGATTGDGTYDGGDSVTVSATENTGYEFQNWTEGGTVVSTDSDYNFSIYSDRNLVANFSQVEYVITTNSNPITGGNTVGGGTYHYGDTATVTATATIGYTFVNWTEGGTVVSTNEDYSFTVTGSRTLVANFSQDAYTITTSSNPTAGGNTSGGGTYNYGDTATVSATANAGYTFVNWTEGGTVVSTNEDYSFTVTASRTLVANFSQDAYTITTSSNPTAGGNTTGGGTYNYGDTATVSATANAGYTFINWTEGGTIVSTDEDYSFTVTSSRTLVANFSQDAYTITTSSNPTVGGSTSGGGTYNYGDTATVSAFANTGYSFTSWTEGGTVVSTNEDYSFTVTASRTLVANFSSNAYTITTSSNPTAGGNTSGGGTYDYGDSAMVSATANAGYTFINWTEGGTIVSTDEDYSFTVTSSRTLVANFSSNAYTITTSSNPTAGGNTSGGGTYNYGDTATVSATANAGYTFINWTEGGTIVSTDEDYSFAVTAGRTLVANFSQDAYTITTNSNPAAGGSTSGGGTFDYGDTATVSATANAGYTFVNWTEGGTVVSTNEDYSFTVTSSRDLVANFSQNAYTITTSSNPTAGGNTTGGGTYNYGDTATVSATANAGYTFVNWTEGGTIVSTNANYSFTVTASRTLVANFSTNTYTITTSSNPTAGGNTTGGGTYNYGDTATVSATANAGYTFINWTEGGTMVSTSEDYSFTVTSSRTLVANFNQNAYTITTSSNPTAGGNTTGGGTYNYGDTATVSATANAGYTFVNWTEGGTVVSTNEDYSFTVTSSRDLVANFSQNAYTITTSSNPTAGGNTSGGGTYNYGDTATVLATANAGYTFINWTEGGTVVSTNEDYSFTVTSSRTLVANFSQNAYTITTSSNPTAGGNTTGGGTYNYGDTATVSATANAGYTFINWTEGGTVVSTNEDYSFTVTSSRDIVANFSQDAYTISTSSNPTAGGSTSGGGTYNYGDTATISATANTGYTFVNWTEGGTIVSANANYSFTVTSSRTLVANFSQNEYTITTSSNPTAGGNTTGGGTYNYGDTATVSATANAGYTFVNWTEGGTVVSTNEDYSFTVTSSRTLVANFSQNAYTITTSSNPTVGGTTSGGGTYNYGDTATVSATANTGYTFVNWTEGGTIVSTNVNYSFTVTASRTLVANFSQDAYTITTSSNPTAGGNTTGGGTYNYGDTATVSATANAGYTFVNWTEGGTIVSTSEDYSFTVTSSRTLVANFSSNSYTITTSSNPTAGGSTSGGGTYDYGDSAMVSAIANAGYTFINWTESGTVVSTSEDYSFTVTSSRDLVANFSQNEHIITTVANPTVGGTTLGGGTYHYGDTATVVAVANTDYYFVNWTENGTVVSTDATYSFTVTEDRNLTANFDEIMSVDDPISNIYGIYPNPVRDFATIMMGDEHINSVQIYHVSGQLVKVLKGNGLNQFEIDMRLYNKTSYIIKVFTDKGVKTFKILRK